MGQGGGISMKKKTMIVIGVLIAILLLFPIPLKMKDGGSVVYKAILYKVSDVHSLVDSLEETENGKEYNEGIIIEILGFEVFNNVE